MREEEPQQKAGYCREQMDLSNPSESSEKMETTGRKWTPKVFFAECSIFGAHLTTTLPDSFPAMPDLLAIIARWLEGSILLNLSFQKLSIRFSTPGVHFSFDVLPS